MREGVIPVEAIEPGEAGASSSKSGMRPLVAGTVDALCTCEAKETDTASVGSPVVESGGNCEGEIIGLILEIWGSRG